MVFATCLGPIRQAVDAIGLEPPTNRAYGLLGDIQPSRNLGARNCITRQQNDTCSPDYTRGCAASCHERVELPPRGG